MLQTICERNSVHQEYDTPQEARKSIRAIMRAEHERTHERDRDITRFERASCLAMEIPKRWTDALWGGPSRKQQRIEDKVHSYFDSSRRFIPPEIRWVCGEHVYVDRDCK